ncbi:N-methyl-L-tryptophan oxidase [Salinisphaera sp. SPP-AMP-43]|uniref:N-methyl-L-tryptophan oxidase n=1 Tax=Salinisphaera sp. SPP-AMP-43 TaxID=3121288 RepID=UPI003C6E71CF
MTTRYAAIVIGCGGLGSAALYSLARQLDRPVLGLEQFELGHSRGGSQDHSRIIRLAQHEQAYAALAPAAYTAWEQVEAESRQQLLLKTGGLIIEDEAARDPARTGKRNINGYIEAFEQFGFDYEQLDAAALMQRWPQFRLQGHERALYQQDTGIVDAGKANATHLALARAHGAEIIAPCPVTALEPLADGCTVVAGEQRYIADHVIVAGGAWTNPLLAPLLGAELPLTVTQEQVTYYATPNLADFSPDRFPVFMWHGTDNYYGFPIYGEVATKLGQHMGGPAVTADTRNFEADPIRQARYRQFLETYIPGFVGPELYTKTCLYTVPPDQNFIIDRLPNQPRVSVAVGAGHAYKFASLIGHILADLAIRGGTDHPIESFGLQRRALSDPAFPKAFHQ